MKKGQSRNVFTFTFDIILHRWIYLFCSIDERECVHVLVCAWLCVFVCSECVLIQDELSPSRLPPLMFAQLRRDSADNRTVASGPGRASQPILQQ